MKRNWRLLALLFLTISGPAAGKGLGHFVSKANRLPTVVTYLKTYWVLFDSLTGDMNKDSRPDKIMIYSLPSGKSADDGDEHIAYLLIKIKGGYILADTNYCLSHRPDGSSYLSIKNGCLLLQFSISGSRGSVEYTYKYRYQQSRMRLIGYRKEDGNYDGKNRRCIDYNLNTGKLDRHEDGKTNTYHYEMMKPLPTWNKDVHLEKVVNTILKEKPIPQASVPKTARSKSELQ